MKIIKGMKESLLSLVLASHELYVVYEKHIYISITSTELFRSSLSDRQYELVSELLGCYIKAIELATLGLSGDCLQEMCFS